MSTTVPSTPSTDPPPHRPPHEGHEPFEPSWESSLSQTTTVPGSHRATQLSGRPPSSPPHQRAETHAPTGLLALPGMLEEDNRPRKVRLLSMLALSIVAGLLLALICLPLVGGVGLTAKSTANTFNDLPAELFAPPLPERSVVLDRNGATIAALHGDQDRVNVPLERIPVTMRQAIVAIEDRRFYEHHGIDYKGVLRAVATNQENGEITQGGSTLTQQYVKNVLITLADTDAGRAAAQEKSIKRKLREARYALALEKKLSKDQILTNYLNIAYFGDGAYGVAAASQHYFGKDISTINAAEAALLAGLVQNPNVYNPKLHPVAAKQRRDTVLAAMGQAGFLPPAGVKFASAVPVDVRKGTTVSDGCEAAGSGAFFCQYLRSTLLNDPGFGPTPEERQRKLFEGGLQIRTSLDPAVQAAAQSAADGIVPAGNRVATAVVILQPGTGEVQAMAVNRVYAPTADGKPVETTTDRVHTKLNYALRPFQPGSTFKVFTVAAALEQGMPLSTTYNSPTCYTSRVFDNPPGTGCFKNAGDSEAGVFSMSQATWHSVNTYFVQLEERTGVLKVRDMAKKLGVASPRLDQVEAGNGSLTLGAFEVTPMDMATAYATLAAHGKRCTPKPVLAVTERGKKSTYVGPGTCEQVLDPKVADNVSSVLQGVIREGTAAANGPIGRPAAGKTGTTEENRSAWFVGYVPQLAAAVWVGDYRSPDMYPLRYSETTPEGVPVPGWGQGTVFGGGLPTLVWSRAMRAATQNLPLESFPPPDHTLARGTVRNTPSGPSRPAQPAGPPPPAAAVPPPSAAPSPSAAPKPSASPKPSPAQPKPSAKPPTSQPKPPTTKPTPKPKPPPKKK